MVVVNLYPFAETVAKEGCTLADAVENIDIGGPTMVRSAAKNHKDVTIVVNAHDYDRVIAELDANEKSLTLETRFDLAIAAFEHTASYDGMIANYFGTMVPSYGENKEGDEESKFPRTFNQQFEKNKTCATVRTATKQQHSTLKQTLKKHQFLLLAKSKVKPFLTTTSLTQMQHLSV